MVVPPLSLYMHFPWCIKKCPYCDFNSHELKGNLSEGKYIETLIRDLENDLDDSIGQRKLKSIFMGGGTPSLFSAKSLRYLLSQVKLRIEFEDNIEITMEANPGSLEHDQFDAYRNAGINRLSLGIQSFNDPHLKVLGRIHNAETAGKAIAGAKSAGFTNFNLDLMYGLPEQTIDQALDDCNQAINHNPSHLSFYQLTLEPNTYFYRHPPRLPDHDQQAEIQHELQALLGKNNYNQYEVSAYAMESMQSIHNLNYWQFGDYLGIGAGAHSKITCENSIVRGWKQKHPENYINQVADGLSYKTTNVVPKDDILFEFMMNALRLKDGISLNLFEQRTGLPATHLHQSMESSLARNRVEISDGYLRCTPQGYLFIDDILQELLPVKAVV